MKTTRDICLCALFVALIAIGAFIRIPIPFVPFTLQLFFTTLAGVLLGAKLGCLSVCVYMLMGLIGIPVFTEGGGITYLLKPNFGYIIGFAIGAFVTGAISHKTVTPSYKRMLCATYSGLIIAYLVGTIYFYLISRFYLNSNIAIGTIILHCVILTIPAHLVLSLLSAYIGKRLIPILNKQE